jgi:hypothetical protein
MLTCFLFLFSLTQLNLPPPAKVAIRFITGHRDELHIPVIMPLKIFSVTQGPKINPPLDSLLLSTLKRKGGSSKVLTHRSKKRIDTKVLNVSDMAGVLTSAFRY